MSTRGVLYIATNETYLQEAKRSAARASRMTEFPITLVAHRDVDDGAFDEVIVDDSPTETMADKSRNLLKSPYDETLYMDTDTYIVEAIPEIFDCLDRAPLAVTVDAHEGSLYDSETDTAVPLSFPEFQAGVMLYRRIPRVEEFIRTWIDTHDPADSPDQLSFRRTLYTSDIEFTILPLRYNALIESIVYGPVKIIHDYNRLLVGLSEDDRRNVLRRINENEGLRVLHEGDFDYVPVMPSNEPLPFRNGMLSALAFKYASRWLPRPLR